MKKTLILADPEIPRAVPGDGMHGSLGHTAYGNKVAILEVGNSAPGGDPNAPVIVLKEGPHPIVRQSTASLSVNRNLAVVPFVQAVKSAKPNAPIPGRQYRPNPGIGQTLLHGDRGDGEFAKAVKAIMSGYPNIAFTIFKEAVNEIAGETVRPRKHVGPSPVHMQEPAVRRSDPQTANAIPQQSIGIELPPVAWKPICLGSPLNEP